jgi:hypothetical protein
MSYFQRTKHTGKITKLWLCIAFIAVMSWLCFPIAAKKGLKCYLDESKPSLYATFSKVGLQEPLWPSDSGNRIWLALHNNTIWDLNLKGYGVPKDYGDCGLWFEVVPKTQSRIPTTIQKYAVKWPPAFETYRLSTYSRIFSLDSGESLVFSVPVESLEDEFALRVPFSYEWENDLGVAAGREPAHFIVITSDVIPKSMRSSGK